MVRLATRLTGGRKASGMGSIYGPEGLAAYLATKCVFLPAAAGAGPGSAALR